MKFPRVHAQTAREPGIFFHHEYDLPDLPDEQQVIAWITHAIHLEGKKLGEVNLIFCSDAYLLDMNRQFLRHDYYTDVITFADDDAAQDLVQGDIYISAERVAENAATAGVSFRHELCRVMMHGVLHLVGYTDTTTAKRRKMTEKEDFYLSTLKI